MVLQIEFFQTTTSFKGFIQTGIIIEADLTNSNKSAMGRLFGILILTSLLLSINGQALFDEMGERQRSADLALHFMRTELQQFSQGIEQIVTKHLEKVKNIEEKIDNIIATQSNESLSIIQTEQRLLRQEIVSLANRVDTLLNKSETNNLMKCENVLDDIRNASFDCADILEKYPNTRWKNGVYNVTASSNRSRAVFCDMTTDNGGWTVINRRVNGSVNFYRNWTDYKNGFGYADHEYWIGNDMLHKLTSLKPQELRVDMERFNGEKAYAVYSNFSVGDEASKYKLQVTGYSGNAGDSLSYSNNRMFSTPDQDNDEVSGNCAAYYRSAGWFYNCFYANPNGQYIDSEKTGHGYIIWNHWKNSMISLKSMQLMIRPRA